VSKTKTTTKTKKTTYKCGHCGEKGHNARTCPTKTTTTTTKTATKTTTTTATTTIPAPLKIEPSVDIVSKSRKGSTPSTPGCFECKRCQNIGVLVLIGITVNGKSVSELRCEKCHNNSPVDVILKWGASPDDKPTSLYKNP